MKDHRNLSKFATPPHHSIKSVTLLKNTNVVGIVVPRSHSPICTIRYTGSNLYTQHWVSRLLRVYFWNSLHNNIKKSNSIKHFRKQLNKLLVSVYE